MKQLHELRQQIREAYDAHCQCCKSLKDQTWHVLNSLREQELKLIEEIQKSKDSQEEKTWTPPQPKKSKKPQSK
jgi:hypothetical protein